MYRLTVTLDDKTEYEETLNYQISWIVGKLKKAGTPDLVVAAIKRHGKATIKFKNGSVRKYLLEKI